MKELLQYIVAFLSVCLGFAGAISGAILANVGTGGWMGPGPTIFEECAAYGVMGISMILMLAGTYFLKCREDHEYYSTGVC